MPIKEIARRLGVARNTVRAALSSDRPSKYDRAPRGQVADAFEQQIRALLHEWPRMPTPVIAERIGWPYSLSTYSPMWPERYVERGQWSGHVGVPFDGLEAVLESVAEAVDRDDVAVGQEPVEDRGGEDLVTEPKRSDGAATDSRSHAGGGRDAWRRALGQLEARGADFVVAGHKDPTRADDPADIGRTRRYLDDADRLLRGAPTPMEYYEGMLSLHPERINPGILWFGALSLLAGDPTP